LDGEDIWLGCFEVLKGITLARMRVTFGVNTIGNMPVSECVEFAVKAEEYGIERFWVADENPTYPFRDVMVILSAVAAKTHKISIGPNICNPYSRHPALLAVAIQSVNELSGGRAIMGLGPGGTVSLDPLGIPRWKKPLQAMRDSTSVLRELFSGKEVNFNSEVFTLSRVRLFESAASRIPIYFGVRGPKMLELAGKVADGVLMQTPPAYLATQMEFLRTGLAEAGRSLADFDVGSVGQFAVDHDETLVREMVKSSLTYQVPDSPRAMLDKIGISKDEAQKLRETRLKEGVQEATKLVTERMIDQMSTVGTPQKVTERILYKIRNGVTHFIFSPPQGRTRMEGLRIIGEEVLPTVRRTLQA
jgi:5,10-methylenetetrahydromethanopterin reductase